jgi:hypothetical protein
MASEHITKDAAAALIAALAQFTRENPSQYYTAEINIGHVGNVIGGSAPVNISATNLGGAGSTTGAIFQATASGSDIEVRVRPILEEFHERFLIGASLLDEIAEHLKTEEPSRGVRASLAKLSELALPAVLIEVVKQLVRAAGVTV